MESNQTALRVLRILSWLIQEPLSINDIQKRCLSTEPDLRELSPDSVGLYIKTLRQLGCTIQRPCPSNRFCYELVAHPFVLPMEYEHLQGLIHIKQTLAHQLDYRTILDLDRLVLQLLDHYPDATVRQDWKTRFFEQTRSMDYTPFNDIIQRIEQALEENHAIRIQYRGSRRGNMPFQIYPVMLLYEQGALYLVAYRTDDVEQTRYRVDRIQSCQTGDPAVHPSKSFLQDDSMPALPYQTVVVDILDDIPFDASPLDMNEHWQYCTRDALKASDGLSGFTRLAVPCTDWFVLKQRLLQLESTFSVRYPEHYVQDMRRTLARMQGHYVQDAMSVLLTDTSHRLSPPSRPRGTTTWPC